MLAFHMFCHQDQATAERIAREPLNRYLRSLVAAASDWMAGERSADYPGYDKIIAALSRDTFETQVEKCAAWVGTPQRILDTVATYRRQIGDFEIASVQVNFNDMAARRCAGIDATVRRGSAAAYCSCHCEERSDEAIPIVIAQHRSCPRPLQAGYDTKHFSDMKTCVST